MSGNIVIACTWLDGDAGADNIDNTGASAGNVWDSHNSGTTEITRDSTGNGYKNETNSLKLDGTFAAVSYYVQEDFSAANEFAIRFFIKPTSFGLGDGGILSLAIFRNSTPANVGYIRITRSGSDYNLQGYYKDSASAMIASTAYAVTAGTGYQVTYLYKTNTAAGYNFWKIYSADGSSELSSSNTANDTHATDQIQDARVGYNTGAGSTVNTYYIDVVRIDSAASGLSLIAPRTD